MRAWNSYGDCAKRARLALEMAEDATRIDIERLTLATLGNGWAQLAAAAATKDAANRPTYPPREVRG